MSIAQWKMIDNAVSAMVVANPTMTEFTSAQVGAIVGLSARQVSEALQNHKRRSGLGKTKNVIQPRGHGRDSRWFIASQAATGEAITMAHALHVCNDGAARMFSDLKLELRPVAKQIPGIQGVLDACTQIIQSSMDILKVSIEQAVSNQSMTTGVAPDMRRVRAFPEPLIGAGTP